MHSRSGLCNLISDCTLHPGPHTPSLTVFPWSWTTHPISAHAFYPSCSLFPASSTTSQTIHRFLDYECSTRLQALIPDHKPHSGPCTPLLTMHPHLRLSALSSATHPIQLYSLILDHASLLGSHSIPVHPHSVSCLHSGPFTPSQTTHPILNSAPHPQLHTPILRCTPSHRITRPNLTSCPLLPKSPFLPILTALLPPPRGATGTHRCGSHIASRPTSLESSCWLMTVRASSDACRLASASARSILARSVVISSWALRSASDTAFCSSDMACRFTSFTASSGREVGSVAGWVGTSGAPGSLRPRGYEEGMQRDHTHQPSSRSPQACTPRAAAVQNPGAHLQRSNVRRGHVSSSHPLRPNPVLGERHEHPGEGAAPQANT